VLPGAPAARADRLPSVIPREEDDLSPAQVGWRVGALAVGVGVLLAAQVVDTNDWFPLGSLSQYAAARPADGSVVATSLEGTTVDGEVVPVRLTPGSVGLSRAEVEGQGQRIIADPELLGALATSRARLHPQAPALRELRLVRTEQQLRDARLVGPRDVRVLARWTVTP
jgi:hypothetical protein